MIETKTKQQALDLFELNQPEWLANARRIARVIAEHRVSRQATVDDIHEQTKVPAWVDGRIMGAVFRGREWQKVGYTESKRKINHGRPIAIFRLKHDGEQGLF